MSLSILNLSFETLYDVKDNNGNWFSAKVIQINRSIDSNNIVVHYNGYSNHFNETITDITRIAVDKTFTLNWQELLEVGQYVDVYIEQIKRWENFKVIKVKIENGDKLIQYSTNQEDNEWISLKSESVAQGFSRVPKRSAQSTRCSFPKGKNSAIAIANKLIASNNLIEGYAIYEELARHRLLNLEESMIAINLLKRVYTSGKIEERRLCDVKEFFFYDCAVDPNRVIHNNNDNDDDDDDDDCDDNNQDSKFTGPTDFLKYKKTFKNELCEDWLKFSEGTRKLLTLADDLETKAGRNQNSLMLRRLLFAEASYLIEKAKSTLSSSSSLSSLLIGLCNFRISRHYINGLGIDITDNTVQTKADIQASEYFFERSSRPNSSINTLLGILTSTGRGDGVLCTSSRVPDCQYVTTCLKTSIECGNPAATYWYANLLYEGWGQQEEGNRKKLLNEAIDLFGLCESMHCFNKTQATTLKEYAEKIVKSDTIDSNKPYYFLTLHIFSTLMKSEVKKNFGTRLITIINQFVDENIVDSVKLRSPPISTSPNASWLENIRDKVLFSTATFEAPVEDEKSVSSAGGGKTPTVNSTMFMNHIIRNSLNNEENFTTGKNWTNQEARSLLDKMIIPAAKTAVKVCEEYDGIVSPVSDAQSRITSAVLSIGNLEQLWQLSLKYARYIYLSIDPINRNLKEQKEAFHDMHTILNSEEKVKSILTAFHPESHGVFNSINLESDDVIEKVAKVVKLAKQLAVSSKEDTPDTIDKHCRSAIALVQYVNENKIPSIEQAIRDLNRAAIPFLQGSLICEYEPRIGYHTIIDALKTNNFLSKIIVPDRLNSRRKLLSDGALVSPNDNMNTHWRKGSDLPLLKLFEDFERKVIMLNTSASPLNPRLSFENLTYQDPWTFLGIVNIDEELKDDLDNARNRVLEIFTEPTPSDILECSDSYLTELIKQRVKIDPSILSTLSNYPKMLGRIEVKKKMLFILKQAIGDIIEQGIENGCKGRCPDGINNFCDNFIDEILFQKNIDALTGFPEPIQKLILNVSSFIYQRKVLFIKKHLSRVIDHHEGRTAGDMVLRYCCMLPLGLPGSLDIPIKYPAYALQGHVNNDQLSGSNVLNRYIDGGTIELVNNNKGTNECYQESFESMTLKGLVNEFKSTIVLEMGSDSINNSNNDNLLPRAYLKHTTKESIIEEFCKTDIIISQYYFEGNTHIIHNTIHTIHNIHSNIHTIHSTIHTIHTIHIYDT